MSFLTKKIINLDPVVFGLDLSDLSVKVLQIEKDGNRDAVRGYGSLDIPAGNIEDGRIINKEKVVAAIKLIMASASARKINSNKVICSLPESKAFVRIISIPKMSEEEASEAVKWEMEANMPMALSEVYYDWQFLEIGSDDKQRVLTAAVSKEVVDSWMEVLALSGLEVYGLEVESIASIRSLIGKNSVENETSLIVDLGAKRTSFIIAEGVIPYFTSSIPFSSEGINDAISKAMNISGEEAEKVKINNGIENMDTSNPIFSAVNPLIENLVVEITKSMDFYVEMSKKPEGIDKIVLCGGGASMKGLSEYLNQRIKKDIVLGNPWVNLDLERGLPAINKDSSIRYATVIGLALKGLNYGS